MAARSIAGQRGRTDRHLCCRHSTDNSGYLFIYFYYYFLIPLFAYSLCSQTSLVALDTWIGPLTSQHIFQHDPLPTYQQLWAIKSCQSAATTCFLQSPRPLSCRYLCAVIQRRAWHAVPAASGMFHLLQLSLLTCSHVTSRGDSGCCSTHTEGASV